MFAAGYGSPFLAEDSLGITLNLPQHSFSFTASTGSSEIIPILRSLIALCGCDCVSVGWHRRRGARPIVKPPIYLRTQHRRGIGTLWPTMDIGRGAVSCLLACAMWLPTAAALTLSIAALTDVNIAFRWVANTALENLGHIVLCVLESRCLLEGLVRRSVPPPKRTCNASLGRRGDILSTLKAAREDEMAFDCVLVLLVLVVFSPFTARNVVHVMNPPMYRRTAAPEV